MCLIELKEGTSGRNIANALLDSLNDLGLTKDILRSRLLGFCTDGASNLHGHVKGALELIAQSLNRADLFMFHCMNHKLELAVQCCNQHQQSLTSPHVPRHTTMYMLTILVHLTTVVFLLFLKS